MRFWPLLQMVGTIVLLVGVAMSLPIVVAIGYGGEDVLPLTLAAAVTIIVGAVARWIAKYQGRGPLTLRHREGFAVVAFAWMFASLFGGLPYYLYARHPAKAFSSGEATDRELPRCRPMPRALNNNDEDGDDQDIEATVVAGWEFCSYSAAVFESASGFTTTGATMITGGLWQRPGHREWGELPHGLLLWRALTHWLGGMGIIVLTVAIFPLLGVGGMDLYKAEAPGPVSDKLVPRASGTAQILWRVYVAITAAEIILLMVGGVPLYDAVIHTFGTIATGGFSNLADSAAGFQSAYVDTITIVFMLIAGTSFALHYHALFKGNLLSYFRDAEFCVFAGTLLVASLFTSALLFQRNLYATPLSAIRFGAFQVVSIATTTGFVSADYAAWEGAAPSIPLLLLLLMFLGGCAGSTAGSIKCVRIWLLLKQGYWNLFHLIHPKAVHPLRMGKRSVSPEVMHAINGFFALYMFIFAATAGALALMGVDVITSLAASAACIGNIGPGLGSVGPIDNYFHLPVASRWLLSVAMLLGRLEIYTLLVLLVPSFWRR